MLYNFALTDGAGNPSSAIGIEIPQPGIPDVDSYKAKLAAYGIKVLSFITTGGSPGNSGSSSSPGGSATNVSSGGSASTAAAAAVKNWKPLLVLGGVAFAFYWLLGGK